jgi:periplasmic divalent cation tolerance protein
MGSWVEARDEPKRQRKQAAGEEAMDETSQMIVVYTTLPTESDARKIGGELVAKKLAACVNIVAGLVSIYRWQGAIETGSETAMLIKTRKDLQDQVLEAIRSLHPYSVPALIVFEPGHVSAAYFEWLCNETAAPREPHCV